MRPYIYQFTDGYIEKDARFFEAMITKIKADELTQKEPWPN
jgi:hypothetical protein